MSQELYPLGAATVTVSAALPAGSNTIGKVDQGAGGASAWKVDGSAVTQPVSATSLPLPGGAAQDRTADLDTGAGTDTRAVVGLVYAAGGGAVLVSAGNPLPVTFAGGVTISGLVTTTPAGTGVTTGPVTTTAGSTASVGNLSGYGGTVGVKVAGTWTGALSFKGSIDGSTYDVAVQAWTEGGQAVTSATANGTWVVNVAGLASLAVVGPTATGSASVTFQVSPGPAAVGLLPGSNVVGAVTQSGAWTVQPGNTGNTTPWLVDTELSAASALSDSFVNPTTAPVGACEMLWDGSNWRRRPGSSEVPLLTSAARTATVNCAAQTTPGIRGVHLVLRVSAASGTGGLTVSVICQNLAGNNYSVLVATVAVTATGTYVYEVYPGAGGTIPAGSALRLSYAHALPPIWFAQVAHGDGSSYTYSLDAELIP